MRNFAETCKDICGYTLKYNIPVYLLPLKSSVFVLHFSNAFYHGREALSKHGSSPCHLSFDITYIGV